MPLYKLSLFMLDKTGHVIQVMILSWAAGAQTISLNITSCLTSVPTITSASLLSDRETFTPTSTPLG
jgi:hypothetical protein